MAEQARWYVIHTYSGYENAVAATIEKAVENVNGTDQIKVLFNAGKLKFVMDSNKTNTDDVKNAIEKMGYEVMDIKEKEIN